MSTTEKGAILLWPFFLSQHFCPSLSLMKTLRCQLCAIIYFPYCRKVKNTPSADIISMFPAKQYTGYDEL